MGNQAASKPDFPQAGGLVVLFGVPRIESARTVFLIINRSSHVASAATKKSAGGGWIRRKWGKRAEDRPTRHRLDVRTAPAHRVIPAERGRRRRQAIHTTEPRGAVTYILPLCAVESVRPSRAGHALAPGALGCGDSSTFLGRASQTRTVPSPDPEIRRVPSGLNATDQTNER